MKNSHKVYLYLVNNMLSREWNMVKLKFIVKDWISGHMKTMRNQNKEELIIM